MLGGGIMISRLYNSGLLFRLLCVSKKYQMCDFELLVDDD